jgi:hypothetical protein
LPHHETIGATNSRGELPADRALDRNDLLATIYRFLGINIEQAVSRSSRSTDADPDVGHADR